jgi:Flp pilus assembly protein TadG
VNVTVFALMLPFMLALLGLSVDGGQMLIVQRDIQGIAEGAARAGAEQLDQNAARTTRPGRRHWIRREPGTPRRTTLAPNRLD